MPRSIVFNKFVCFKCSYHLQQQMVYRYFDLNKGTNSFPTSIFYNNPNMAVQISYVYSITLTQAMNDTIYRVGLGVQSQNTFISSGDYFFYFELSTPLTKTAFPIILSTTHMNLVQLYTFNYITVVSNWGNIAFNTIAVQLATTITSSTSYSGIVSTNTALNTTSLVKTFCIFTGFALTASSNTELSLIIAATRSSTSINYILTSKSASNIAVK